MCAISSPVYFRFFLLCKQVQYALAWGNLQLFDFNNRLQTEKLSLYLWPMPQGMDDLLNPIGLPGKVIHSVNPFAAAGIL